MSGSLVFSAGAGVRIEELTELSHHSLIQHTLPASGELIPLLQIAPSKTNTERLLVISPELADVLSTVICRIRNENGAVLIPRRAERTSPSFTRLALRWSQWR